MTVSSYNDTFFSSVNETGEQSASRIVPWLVDMLRPVSVLDIGCGQGPWLSAFKLLGIDDICGIDGDYVDANSLKFNKDQFKVADLSKSLLLNRFFDLALCLEVAEHLEERSANQIVETISRHTNAVLFSAAVPLQTGTDHYNEQWPGYWIDLFKQREFQLMDVVRPLFWDNELVAPWYRQNALIFTRSGDKYADDLSARLRNLPSFHGKAVINPTYWLQRNSELAFRAGNLAGPRALLSKLPSSVMRAIGRRIRDSAK